MSLLKFSAEKNPSASLWVKSLYVLGGLCTVIYLVMMVFYSYPRVDKLLNMPPNELGDFLAGAFAPLAFFWLVLGFFQQGVELRQNSKALLLQAEELRAAAAHAGAMVELQRTDVGLRIKEVEEANAQLAAANEMAQKQQQEKSRLEDWRRAQPDFIFPNGCRYNSITMFADSRTRQWSADLINEGADCSNVQISLELPEEASLKIVEGAEIPLCEAFLPSTLVFQSGELKQSFKGRLVIDFVDSQGAAGTHSYLLRRVGKDIDFLRDDSSPVVNSSVG